jgi:membrane fusion protein (multidrug efflux system)
MILRSFFNGFLAIAILLSLFSCNSENKKEANQSKKGPNTRPPVKADAYIVTQKEIQDNLEIPGTLVANEATDIHPEVSGRITGIFFKEGAYVSKGALLVKLYDADLQAQKQKLEVQIKIAQQNQDRSEQLLKIGGISRQDYDNMVLTVSNAKADLDVINTSIQKTNIRAPFNGKLGLRMVSLGAYVSPAITITTISQMSQMKIDFTVPEKYTRQVPLGQYINFHVEGSSKNYAAKVIATESNIAENTRTLQVRAQVQGDQSGLVPGAFARVNLQFQPDPNSIAVPTQAIIPEARGKKVYIYQDGIAKYTDVTTGVRDSANVEVTSGLKPGDTILLTGLMSVKPNSKVVLGKIVNETKQPAQQGTAKGVQP